MAKGENIFKRKDGRWEARYVKGHQPSGKIIYGFCYGKSYRQAKQKAAEMRLRHMSEDAPEAASQAAFSHYCRQWLEGKKSRVKIATYAKYETMLDRHILPQLGQLQPAQLSSETIEDFSNTLLHEKHLAPKTIRDILTCLRAILQYVSRCRPEPTAVPKIVYPKAEQKEMRVLSLSEQTQLTEYLLTEMDSCKFGVLLALLTGMRIGEICALHWGDIDLKDKVIHVHATMQRVKNIAEAGDGKTAVVIGSPKSDKSVRTIPVTPNTALLCTRMQTGSKADFVLTGTQQYMEPRTLQYRLKRYTADCELEGVHFHTLRHTFATRAVEVGFEIKTLSEILGHSTTTVTLDRYVHSSLEMKRANMRKLDMVGM